MDPSAFVADLVAFAFLSQIVFCLSFVLGFVVLLPFEAVNCILLVLGLLVSGLMRLSSGLFYVFVLGVIFGHLSQGNDMSMANQGFRFVMVWISNFNIVKNLFSGRKHDE